MKDWTGNNTSIYATLGASNHSEADRHENDYYATEPKAVEKLLEKESFYTKIWEPACGGGHISEVLLNHGYDVFSSDKYNYGYIRQNKTFDFFEEIKLKETDRFDIITNPPYKYAMEFCEKAINTISNGNRVAMLLKLTFLEGKARLNFFKKFPPKKIYVFSSRINCAKNGDFSKNISSAVCYAWYIWEKDFKGKPEIDWIE